MINKIIIGEKISFHVNNNIAYQVLSNDDDIIKNISLDILNSDNLKLEYNIKEELKINFTINIHDNVSFKLMDEKSGLKIKSKYTYIIGHDSLVTVNRINDIDNIKEYDEILLNGENAKIDYILKTVSIMDEQYNIVVKHNAKNTISNIITSGVNIKNGKILMNVTGFVPKGCTGTIVNQNNRIINLTPNICSIYPNLLIDEMDALASHSAHISNFSDEEMFYLKARGIKENDATKLLIKGLFIDNMDEAMFNFIDKIMKKYWR